jgi:hypothetical protein
VSAREHDVHPNALASVVASGIRRGRPFVVIFPTVYGDGGDDILEDAHIWWNETYSREEVIDLLGWAANEMESEDAG